MSDKSKTEELQLKIQETQKVLSELQNELKKQANIEAENEANKYKIVPKEKEMYYRINTLNNKVHPNVNNKMSIGKEDADTYNYFTSINEAQSVLTYFNTFLKAYHIAKVINNGKMFFDNGEKRVYPSIMYNKIHSEAPINTENNSKTYFDTYFTPIAFNSKEDAELFNKIMGDDIFKLMMLDKEKLVKNN